MNLRIDIADVATPTPADELRLRVRYVNQGDAPLALAFWWTRTLRVVDESGRVVEPGPGPVLPCGVQEDWTVIEPGGTCEREEPIQCTQPAGQSARIGWSYADLAPGAYTMTLVMRAPPEHGFTQSEPHMHAFAGAAESNAARVVIAEPKKRGLLDRVLGR